MSDEQRIAYIKLVENMKMHDRALSANKPCDDAFIKYLGKYIPEYK